jgi:hypothetical protein
MIIDRLRSSNGNFRMCRKQALANRAPACPYTRMPSRYPDAEAAVKARFELVSATLDERGRRLFAASEALTFGHGGSHAVARATGLARSTIARGILELKDLESRAPPEGRQRQHGGGRKRVADIDPGLIKAVTEIVSAATRGDGMCQPFETAAGAFITDSRARTAGKPGPSSRQARPPLPRSLRSLVQGARPSVASTPRPGSWLFGGRMTIHPPRG